MTEASFPCTIRPAPTVPHAAEAGSNAELASPADAQLVQLLARMAERDPTALQLYMDLQGARLRRFILRLNAQHAECDDILQEVFWRAWQQAGTFRRVGSAEGWLLRIALRVTRNRSRALGRIKRLWTRAASWLQAGDIPSPTKAYEAADLVGTALQRLAPGDRELLVLVYLEQEPLEIVADLLGITLNALSVRLVRARKRLKYWIERFSAAPDGSGQRSAGVE